MSRFYKVGIILISIMFFVALPASVHGQTDGNVGSFVLNPNTGPGCTIVKATGSGFNPSWLVTLDWNPPNDVLLASGTTDSSGNFSLSFTVPNVPPGDYPVIANVFQPPCTGIACPATSPGVSNKTSFVVTQESVQSNAYCAQAVTGVDTLPSTGFDQQEWFFYIIMIPIAGLAGFMMIKKWRRA